MTQPMTCPKCGSDMESGFILDRAPGPPNSNVQEKWLEGTPTPSFWTGVKTQGREPVPVTTFRCHGCGYLESFAMPT